MHYTYIMELSDQNDKAPNNIVFVYKSHYVDCLIKELGIDLATLHIPR